MALDLPAAGWTSRIARLLEDLDFAISPAIETAFSVYLDQVVTWNARMDLTAARTLDELVDLSFADAVVIAREERRRSGALEARWADVGSGAGAPGIPLFLLLSEGAPSFSGTLVEPRVKRVAFLRSVLGTLGLDGVDVVRSRSDALAAHTFSHTVARATLPPPRWLEEGARLSTEAVWVLLAREPAPSHPGWSIDHELSYWWPATRVARRALRYVPTPRGCDEHVGGKHPR